LRRNFVKFLFWPPKFFLHFGEVGPKFASEFYKCGSPSNNVQSLVKGLVINNRATSEIRREKKKDLKDRSKTKWPARPA